MKLRTKPLGRLTGALCDALWRANNVPKATAWLDGLGLEQARRHWRVGAAWAEVDGDRWHPSARGTGRPVVVAPVMAAECSPVLDDVLAFDPKHPSSWWTMNGNAVVLGRDLVLPMGAPVRLWPDPLAWARANSGVVVLDADRARDILHDGRLTLVVSDPDHGHKIKKALERPLPRIMVDRRAA